MRGALVALALGCVCLVGCNHRGPSGAGPDAGARVDLLPVDTASDLTHAAGVDGGTFACHDDRPTPGTPFVEGGSSCTLPDGGAGVGSGFYGCLDPTVCHCKPEAGPADCRQSRGQGVCVYAGCNGANDDELCQLGASSGVCCAGTCAALDFETDNHDCGGCGVVCAPGSSCQGGMCMPACTFGHSCGGGLTCAQASVSIRVGGWAANGCFGTSCTGKPDGTDCMLPGQIGICCAEACVSLVADTSCGGCGIQCCTGTHCSPSGSGLTGVCL